MTLAQGRYFEGTRSIHLGERLGRGGEGEVFALGGDPKRAVKLYAAAGAADREAKIAAMVRARLAASAPTVAFPLAVVRTDADRFAGFVMPRVSAAKPVHELYGPGARKKIFPDADYRFLVRAALNAARAVAATHRAGCVIGDINHSGFLISDQALVALIDADSFQFADGAARYLCRVGVPEYTAPELQGRSLGGVVRTENHDAFGLAVILFQLLFMGRHPFSGRPKAGDLPIPEAIRGHHFAYSRRRATGLDPPPATGRLTDFPGPVADLFESAFGPPGSAARPSAAAWVRTFEALERALRPCPNNAAHHYPRAAPDCPWCRMEAQSGVPLFVPPVRTASGPTGDAVTLPPFVEALLRARLDAIETPETVAYAPPPPRTSAAASPLPRPQGVWARLVAHFAPAREAWRELRVLDAKLYRAVADIQVQIDIDAAWLLKAELGALIRRRAALAAEAAAVETRYRTERHHLMTQQHLEGRFIAKASIRGIGPSLVATLASFGFETAADLRRRDVRRTPGIGPVKADALHDWARGLAARFTPPPALTPQERAEISRRRLDVAREAQDRDARIGREMTRLEELARAIATARTTRSTRIDELLARRVRLVALIEARRGVVGPASMPPARTLRAETRERARTVSASTPPQAAAGSAPSRGGPNPSHGSGLTASCPVCGAPMVRRTARRGRKPGQVFLGCSRFPACWGTRPGP